MRFAFTHKYNFPILLFPRSEFLSFSYHHSAPGREGGSHLITRLLEKASILCLKHPVRVILWSALPCLLLSFLVPFVPLNLSFMSMLNNDDPLIARYNKTSTRLNLSGRLLLLLQGPEEHLDAAVDEISNKLTNDGLAECFIAELPEEWAQSYAPWLVEKELFDGWLGLATTPQEMKAAQRFFAEMGVLRAELEAQRRPGTRLVVVQMKVDPISLPVGENGFRDIESAVHSVLDGSGIEISFSGTAAASQQDQERVLKRVALLTPISFMLVLLIFSLVERRPFHLLAVSLPMLLAMGSTLAVVGVLTGEITIIEAFFGVMVFGLGIDFALHLMTRLRSEQLPGRDFSLALHRTILGSGRAVVSGAVTTAGAFIIFCFAPDTVARHLGMSGGVGLLFCLVLMLTLLPAIWVLLERRGARPISHAVRFRFLGAMAQHSTQHPKLYLLAAFALLVTALAGSPRFHFETDLKKVFSRDVPAIQDMERVQATFGVNAGPWIAITDSLEEARQMSKAFGANPLFSRVDSLASLLPADLEQRAQRLAANRETIVQQLTTSRILLALATGIQAAQLRALIQALEALEKALETGPPTVQTLPSGLRKQLFTSDDKYLVYAYAKEPTLDGYQARTERLAAQAIAPEAAGISLLFEAILLAERPWLKYVFVSILLFVVLVLAVDMRCFRWMLVALTPVLFGASVTFGVFCWLDIGFNLMTIIMVPLIIGLGVDDGIHVVHRLRENTPSPAYAVASVSRAILLTTLTTCSSFAVFLFTDHPGLEGMALVLLVGLPLCLLASVTVIPALAVVLGLTDAGKEDR